MANMYAKVVKRNDNTYVLVRGYENVMPCDISYILRLVDQLKRSGYPENEIEELISKLEDEQCIPLVFRNPSPEARTKVRLNRWIPVGIYVVDIVYRDRDAVYGRVKPMDSNELVMYLIDRNLITTSLEEYDFEGQSLNLFELMAFIMLRTNAPLLARVHRIYESIHRFKAQELELLIDLRKQIRLILEPETVIADPMFFVDYTTSKQKLDMLGVGRTAFADAIIAWVDKGGAISAVGFPKFK